MWEPVTGAKVLISDGPLVPRELMTGIDAAYSTVNATSFVQSPR